MRAVFLPWNSTTDDSLSRTPSAERMACIPGSGLSAWGTGRVEVGPASPGPQSRQQAAGFTSSWKQHAQLLGCVQLFVTTWISPPGSSVCVISLARILEWIAISSCRGILLTQGSNPGLPHCRRVLYQLSYQGRPCYSRTNF